MRRRTFDLRTPWFALTTSRLHQLSCCHTRGIFAQLSAALESLRFIAWIPSSTGVVPLANRRMSRFLDTIFSGTGFLFGKS